MLKMQFCAVSHKKVQKKQVGYTKFSLYYSAFQGGCKGANSQFIREISIFIDEKIYSVDRQAKIQSKEYD